MVRRPHGHVCVCRVCISRCDRASSVVFLVPGDEACRGGARRNSKHGGGAGRRAGAGGGARGFHVCECAEPRYLIYNSSAQPRLTRAVQQTPLARPSTAISFHRAPAGSGRPRGAGRVASERAHTNVRRPQNVQREEGEARTCVCGARVDSLRSRTDHTPQPTLSRLAVALGQ